MLRVLIEEPPKAKRWVAIAADWLRHTAYHVLDHTWEMEDRDLTAT
jgi:hypothetical protein